MARIHVLRREQVIERELQDVFAFFSDASNLEAITPKFLRFRIRTPVPIAMHPGARIDYALSLFGLPLRWRSRITVWEPGVRFVDVQESGPYALWRHTHEFESRGRATLMRDMVEYALPLGPLGSLAHALFVKRTLGLILDFRARAIREQLETPTPAPDG